MYSKRIEITGKKFGKLTVLRYSHTNGNAFWKCRCDCGTETIVNGVHLRSGHTKSCGCLMREALLKATTRHGLSKSREHKAWCGIKTRCFNSNRKQYIDYGGRGITMSEEWLDSFEQFYSDMGPKPTPEHSIERIDNDGNYCKENCRWASLEEQGANKRNNIIITYGGKTQTLSEWSRELNIQRPTLALRIKKGWTIEDAFFLSVSNTKRIYKTNKQN